MTAVVAHLAPPAIVRAAEAELIQAATRAREAAAALSAALDRCAGLGSLEGTSLRRYLRARRARDDIFGAGLFADPAWDMLLDLFAREVEDRTTSVTSLCLAAGCPPTTALRWVERLIGGGLVERVHDLTDGRRTFVELTPAGRDAMRFYIACHAPDWPEALS